MYISLIIKTIFMYFFIIFIYRLMGKKEIGQLNIVDLIVSLLIAELISFSLQNNSNILMSVIPIIILTILQISISYITLKNINVRKLIEGKQSIIIKNGKINFSEMSKLRYSLDDLLQQLRLNGVKSIDKVKYAILENNGELSIFNDDSDYPLPLILDGVIDYEVLNEIDKDYNWIINILKSKKLSLDEVFYAFYTNGKTFIIKKSELL